MARSKTARIAEMSDPELMGQLAESRDELFKLRFQLVTGELENHSRLHQVKRQIARVHTELREREIAAAEAAAANEEQS